jgi:hypothetical protein
MLKIIIIIYLSENENNGEIVEKILKFFINLSQIWVEIFKYKVHN